tara:strand:+ start:157 stop:609 length:453 start_codon:yes stop_codon:yes gene_type:complete
MLKKDTLNIYEVLEALNNKINNNTVLIEDNFKQLKIKLDESKLYLLETIEQKEESFENIKLNNSKHERLVNEEFKKLKIDINNDLKNLTNKVKEDLIFLTREINKINILNTDQINKKHNQLMSGEMEKLRSDINKDLNNIIESIKNIKIF